MITSGLVPRLGLAQLLCWGLSYYLVAVFGEAIAADLGWSITTVHGGLSGALVVMGLASGPVGRLIDAEGGRRVMTGGSLLMAFGLAGLSLSHGPWFFGISWLLLGLAMRMTLYEAAFATLARLGGPGARLAMSRITLLGGLASTLFWPAGQMLGHALGWRGALACYAALALLTVPLHWSIPAGPGEKPAPEANSLVAPLAQGRGEGRIAATLFGLLMTAAATLNAGLSAHMIGMMTGLGLAAGSVVWLSALQGIGQSGARLCATLCRRLDPLALGLLAASALPVAVGLGFLGGLSVVAAAGFALVYGAGNGLLTIARGTQPLVLFDPASYGAISGRLAAPGFYAAAFAPIAYAGLIEMAGSRAALLLSLALAGVSLACAFLLWQRFGRKPRA